MAEPPPNRRLAAILAADVVGYSRLMAADEEGTLAALKRHRQGVFDPAVARHHGRVVKLIGDGTLVEFASVVDAVSCALAVQRAVKAAPAEGPAIVLRIGINLGDVIIDGEDIYGDGVNLAARLEALAEPGGICIAAIVHESAASRVDAVFRDGGTVAVKNIDRPVGVWRWHPDGDLAPGRPPAPAAAAPRAEPRSIAVLPFDNMSADPDQEYFSDGITEDIITDLSKVAGLLVIARNSSFAYKHTSPDVRTVGHELGVATVLEGSVRRAANRVRITAQLVDAASGRHLWAERYDRDLTDIFAVQDEVTRRIVEALEVTLRPAEAALLGASRTASVEAHDLFLRGRELLRGTTRTRESFEQIVALFRRAIALDPGYAEPLAGLSVAYGLDYQNRWSGASDSLDLAVRYAAEAIEKAPNDPYGHYAAAVAATWARDLAKGKAEADAALALNPNFALAYGTRGLIEVYAGNPQAAILSLEQAIRLDPAFTHQYLHFLGSAWLVAGNYQAAADTFRERIRLAPQTDLTRALLAAALGHLGQIQEARQVWRDLGQVNPGYSVADHLGRLPFRDPSEVDRIREGLAKAGLPD